ncbi:MAG: PepSY-like domain-containing protein [Prevotellaceae bacterium]|nr:PepSY-like domain-containing protein [Prevotellaceae bacterium]MDD7107470.1 PepSY-like domain-containing protein [Prevotellaceae bacterium]MDY3294732.1 PepSY-like domain-containing protein [Bacteroidaceae bacterium]
MEREFTGKEYKAYIHKNGNAYKLEFDAKGQIKDMDAQGKKALPDSSIPAMIVDYVKENFTGSKIMEWSQSRKLQVVELDNDMELVFDRHGNLVKIDD